MEGGCGRARVLSGEHGARRFEGSKERTRRRRK